MINTNNIDNEVFQDTSSLTQHYSPVQWVFNLLTIFAGSTILSFLVVFYASLANNSITFQGSFTKAFAEYIDTGAYIYSFFYCLLFLLLFMVALLWGKVIGKCLFAMRIPLAIGFVLICTNLSINTLSPGIHNLNVQNADPDLAVVLGESLTQEDMDMNADAFGTGTAANPFGHASSLYKEFEPPVQGFFSLFRPFQLGFKFLPLNKALGFYFSARLACLMLVSLQLGLLLTDGNKKLGLLFMSLVSFAPATQWWFYSGNFVEMLIFGQSLVLCVHFFLATNRNIVRTLLASLFCYTFLGFILVLNLTWQAPFIYVFAGLIIWQLITYYHLTSFSLEWDSSLLVISLIVLVLLLIFFATEFRTVYATALSAGYPLFDVSNGGGGAKIFGNEVANFFTPIFENPNDLLNANPFEIATFWSLFPIGFILAIINLAKNKGKDSLSIILLIVDVFLFVYIVFGFPGFLAHATLLSATYPARAMVAFSFVNLLLLLRGISVYKWTPPLWLSLIFALSAFIYLRYYSGKSFNLLYTSQMMVVQGIILYFLGTCVFEYRKRKTFRELFLYTMLSVSILTGFLINPIRIGLEPVDRTRIYAQIHTAMEENPNGVWVLGKTSPEILNVFAISGAKSIPSANIYNNIEFWLETKPEGKNLTYKCFENLNIYLQNTLPTHYNSTSSGADLFLSTNDFKKLGVGFVITNDDLTILNNEYMTFKKIDENRIGTIYKVVYSSKKIPENTENTTTKQKKAHPNLLKPEQGA